MARKPTSRETTLIVVLALVGAGGLYYQFGGGPASRDGASPGATTAVEGGEPPVVYMALLTKPPEPYDPQGRDLFKYADRPLTAAELAERERLRLLAMQRQKEDVERQRVAAEARRAFDEREKRKAAPKRQGNAPPSVDFAYLGFFGPKEDKIAVFEEGKELLLARAGEVIQDDFILKEINHEMVVIGYTKQEFRGKTTELTMVKPAGGKKKGRRR